MTSELRPASEVWSIACGAYEDATADLLDLPMRDMVVAGDEAAAAVIEADREAVRAEQAAELAKFKALAEELAGALGTAIPYIVEQATPCNGYKCREPWCLSCNYDEEDAEAAAGNGKAAKADATEALREYKEARDAS